MELDERITSRTNTSIQPERSQNAAGTRPELREVSEQDTRRTQEIPPDQLLSSPVKTPTFLTDKLYECASDETRRCRIP